MDKRLSLGNIYPERSAQFEEGSDKSSVACENAKTIVFLDHELRCNYHRLAIAAYIIAFGIAGKIEFL